MTDREKMLLDEIRKLEARVEVLERRFGETPKKITSEPGSESASGPASAPVLSLGNVQQENGAASTSATPQGLPAAWKGVNLGVLFDGYYSYNFNHPADRLNSLRANDVSSNAFGLNQSALIVEKPVNVNGSQRWGMRLDLQFGQATQTMQGNPANEPRPEIYRAIYQAYGTYVVPAGKGLTVDFGKFSSSLGIEGNYAKDQMNYSRSYLFDYLPFYHFGFRSNYAFNNKVNLSWWLVNGVQQSEDFNGFKSNAFLLNVKPNSKISWNLNYYFGEEGRALPTMTSAPRGKLHIFDTYASWSATKNTSFAIEGDYVVSRVDAGSAPRHVSAGAIYWRRQLPNNYALAARAEYLSDRGGLFSSANQALKEGTLTLERKLTEGFLIRTEWRHDFSNIPYFLTPNATILKKSQSTATLGMVWWLSNKEGAW